MKQNKETGKIEREYQINENFFESIDTEEKAYILGFLYADGCNYVSKSGQKEIIATQLEQDKDILEQIKTVIESTYPLYTEIQKENGKTKYIFRVTSNKLSDDLYKLGVVYKKSLILTFPDLTIFKSDTLIRHFIRGVFDGDGCIWMGKPKYREYQDKKTGKIYTRLSLNTKFTFTGNIKFIEPLQDYLVSKISLSKTKLNFSKAKNKNNNTSESVCTMEYSGKGNIKKLYDYMYTDSTIYGNRKKSKFEEIFCADSKKLLSESELNAENPLES